jgi:hypothetical protein
MLDLVIIANPHLLHVFVFQRRGELSNTQDARRPIRLYSTKHVLGTKAKNVRTDQLQPSTRANLVLPG